MRSAKVRPPHILLFFFMQSKGPGKLIWNSPKRLSRSCDFTVTRKSFLEGRLFRRSSFGDLCTADGKVIIKRCREVPSCSSTLTKFDKMFCSSNDVFFSVCSDIVHDACLDDAAQETFFVTLTELLLKQNKFSSFVSFACEVELKQSSAIAFREKCVTVMMFRAVAVGLSARKYLVMLLGKTLDKDFCEDGMVSLLEETRASFPIVLTKFLISVRDVTRKFKPELWYQIAATLLGLRFFIPAFVAPETALGNKQFTRSCWIGPSKVLEKIFFKQDGHLSKIVDHIIADNLSESLESDLLEFDMIGLQELRKVLYDYIMASFPDVNHKVQEWFSASNVMRLMVQDDDIIKSI